MSQAGERLEQFVIDVIEDRRRGAFATVVRWLLLLLSLPFKAVVQFRLWLYRKRILRESALGVLVISVGNLTAGGTGKTPVTEKFARALHAAGRRVAILSRGYRSEKPPFRERFRAWLEGRPMRGGATRVVSDGEQVLLDSRLAGDEPYMLARNLPGVVVLTDKDRVRSGRLALDEFKADTLLLDDGLQYLHLSIASTSCWSTGRRPSGTATCCRVARCANRRATCGAPATFSSPSPTGRATRTSSPRSGSTMPGPRSWNARTA